MGVGLGAPASVHGPGWRGAGGGPGKWTEPHHNLRVGPTLTLNGLDVGVREEGGRWHQVKSEGVELRTSRVEMCKEQVKVGKPKIELMGMDSRERGVLKVYRRTIIKYREFSQTPSLPTTQFPLLFTFLLMWYVFVNG